MPNDDELEAMKKIASALEPLDDAARQRALQWAVSRFRNGRLSNESLSHAKVSAAPANSGAWDGVSQYETFAELFDAANPSTEKEKALVAAYWSQICQNESSFQAQSLNSDLKDLGHGVGNITEALSQLKNDRPSLVLQLKKSGSSRQARKTYKLTQEGVRRVQQMIGGPSQGEDE